MPLSRSVRFAATLAGAAVLVATPGLQGAADASSSLRVWKTGTVKAVADGDTIWVDYAGDGSKKTYKIRLAAIQATETTHRDVRGSKNWCHGQAAGSVLRKLVLGKKVQLRAAHKGSSSQGRPLRYVYVKVGGRWTDVQAMMLQRAQVMNFNFHDEHTNNATYSKLAQIAATTHKGIWDTDTCGVGPAQSTALRTWVHWDAQGEDDKNLNDEYVVFENNSSTALSLKGWMVRDTSLLIYRFPTWASIAPHSYVRLHVGKGTNSAQDFHWNQKLSVFQNTDSHGQSDVVVLMDPQGDFRTWGAYPCRYRCTDPNTGKLRFGAVVYDPDGDDNANPNAETWTIENTSDAPIRLGGYYAVLNGWYNYTFSPAKVLAPHEVITFHVGKGTTSADSVYLGMTGSHLPNTGGKLTLLSWAGPRLACTHWGNVSC